MTDNYKVIPYSKETLERVHKECSSKIKRLVTNYNALRKAVTFPEQQLYISTILVTMCEINETLDYLGRCYLLLSNDTEVYKSPFLGVYKRLMHKYSAISNDDFDRAVKIHSTRNSYIHHLDKKTRVTDVLRQSFVITMCDSQNIINKLYSCLLIMDSAENVKPLEVF